MSGRFFADDSTSRVAEQEEIVVDGFGEQCWSCTRFHAHRFEGNFCDAYPALGGVPPEILTGRVSHDEPYPGDHGLTRDPKPEVE